MNKNIRLYVPSLQEKVIKDVLLVDQPIKRFVKPEEVRWLPCTAPQDL